MKKDLQANYIFEVSWEVCNKVGGIHTVISTKAVTLKKELGDKFILIGPDVWRDSEEHPEFAEDTNLLSGWKNKAASEGLRVRVGRWKIASRPLVFLIDFTTFFSKKDEIFAKFWETYKLDSISGQWDYLEPSLFGYASAKVIESYVRYHLTSQDKVIAQFHEWMTGAGLLYLKTAMPQIGTVFTTHATVIGRSIAGNQQPLYSKMDEYNGDVKAAEFQVISKQSMEKICAANADSFTTVSDLTARECKQFLEKEVDIVTPNGFEDSFVPEEGDFDQMRAKARKSILQTASALLGDELKDDTFIIANSGRYEFRNKGIDLFIDALDKLREIDSLKRKVLALILIPANHYGPRKDLSEKLRDPSTSCCGDKYLTHNLHYAEYDPILNRIRAAGLFNDIDDRVKVMFVPSYLNGNDGIFNIPYYDLLIGMDLTVFPSYYEPWGYTPMESLAFYIPTVTTTLTGFGLWVMDEFKEPDRGIFVIPRDDHNDAEVVEGIAKAMYEMQGLKPAEIKAARKRAFEISRIALWVNLVSYYKRAYSIALEKVSGRVGTFVETERVEQLPEIEQYAGEVPGWRKVLVQQNIPKKLRALEELSKNLWWSWNIEAAELFQSVDPELWEQSLRNPIVLLERITYEKLSKLEKDSEFVDRLNKVYSDFKSYMSEAKYASPEVAYFSMEFGLHESLKIYSGGLGLLAGDYLKEASDYNYNIIGVGLLYRFGYFKQEFTSHGDQISTSEHLQFSKIPVSPVKDEQGNWKEISIVLPGRHLSARIWRVDVGRVKLYLLDTDFEVNQEEDRSITHHLYGGDNENRFKQELLLGIGGIRALRVLGHLPDVYHCNEGHAAFIGLERLREFIQDKNTTYPEALEIVRSSTLFTTHTPVPAGHDYFDEGMMRAYIAHYPNRLNITWEQLMNLGKMHPGLQGEKFSMSCLAVNLSQAVNGVSRLHGWVSQEMFADMWKGYLPEEVPIGYVTNGVHVPTWTAKPWRDLYRSLDHNIYTRQEERGTWQRIKDVDQSDIWNIRNQLRKELIDFMKKRIKVDTANSHQNPKTLVEIQERLDPNALTIGFARRFATYKRAHLLFRDTERLASIVNNPFMPVQFVFAGKAHPRDKAGQDLIKGIIEISRQEKFLGKIVFLENYEIPLAKKLLHGVDIWLNTPARPLEASGTSGEKAVMNGVIHFSVLDGWWAEGYKPGGGWALSEEQTYANNDFQDQLDAETIYSLLEDEITPLFYKRDARGVPVGWVNVIQESIASIAPEFTMNRMIRDYISRYYEPLHQRSIKLKANDYEIAARIAAWKRKVLNAWTSIEIVSVNYPDFNREAFTVGNSYSAEVVLDLKTLDPDEIAVELVVAEELKGGKKKIIIRQEFEVEKTAGSTVYYKLETSPNQPGIFDYGIRFYPKNELLAHFQDMNRVRWI